MTAEVITAPETATKPALLHSSEHAQLWLGDSRDVLDRMPKESVDLVVTDPPYGIEWQSNQRTVKFDQLIGDGAAEREAVREIIEHCVRLVGQNRHLYVFGPDDILEGQKVSEVVPLIWDKGTHGGGDITTSWAPAHEPISFCTSKYRHGGQAGKGGMATRLRRGSVLRYTRPTGRNVRHPSEKPVPLIRELIESSSRPGETVLDPYAGSGATGVAAILAGRKVVLVEKYPRWAELALERILKAERIIAEAGAV